MSNFHLLPPFLFALVILVLLTFSQPSIAQWQQTNGPAGVDVHSLSNRGDTLYAGTGGGLYKLLPGKKTWDLIAFSGHSISDVWATSDRLYAAVIDTVPDILPGSILFSSTDHGTTWENAGGVFSHTVTKFWAIASTHDGGHEVTYVSASFVNLNGFNLYSSITSDSNATWTPVTTVSGLPNVWVRALTSINDTLFAATSGGLYLKAPGVALWKKVSGVASTAPETGIGFDGSTMYVGTSDGIFYSTDRTSWTRNPSLLDIRSFATVGNITVADDSLQYYATTDHGIRWSLVPSTSSLLGHTALLSQQGNLVVATQHAIFGLAPLTFALTQLDSGIINNDVYTFNLVGDKLYAETKEGFAWTSDAGDSWRALATENHPGRVRYLASSANKLFAGGSGLFRTTDEGATWDTLKGGLNNFETVNSLAASDSTIYVGSSIAATAQIPSNCNRRRPTSISASTVSVL